MSANEYLSKCSFCFNSQANFFLDCYCLYCKKCFEMLKLKEHLEQKTEEQKLLKKGIKGKCQNCKRETLYKVIDLTNKHEYAKVQHLFSDAMIIFRNFATIVEFQNLQTSRYVKHSQTTTKNYEQLIKMVDNQKSTLSLECPMLIDHPENKSNIGNSNLKSEENAARRQLQESKLNFEEQNNKQNGKIEQVQLKKERNDTNIMGKNNVTELSINNNNHQKIEVKVENKVENKIENKIEDKEKRSDQIRQDNNNNNNNTVNLKSLNSRAYPNIENDNDKKTKNQKSDRDDNNLLDKRISGSKINLQEFIPVVPKKVQQENLFDKHFGKPLNLVEDFKEKSRRVTLEKKSCEFSKLITPFPEANDHVIDNKITLIPDKLPENKYQQILRNEMMGSRSNSNHHNEKVNQKVINKPSGNLISIQKNTINGNTTNNGLINHDKNNQNLQMNIRDSHPRYPINLANNALNNGGIPKPEKKPPVDHNIIKLSEEPQFDTKMGFMTPIEAYPAFKKVKLTRNEELESAQKNEIVKGLFGPVRENPKNELNIEIGKIPNRNSDVNKQSLNKYPSIQAKDIQYHVQKRASINNYPMQTKFSITPSILNSTNAIQNNPDMKLDSRMR